MNGIRKFKLTSLLLMTTVMLAAACGSCTLATTKPSADGASPSASMQSNQSPSSETDSGIRDDLRKKFMEFMADNSVSEGFALLSEGGFSGMGNGQTLILTLKDGHHLRWTTNAGDLPESLAQFKDVPDAAKGAFAEIQEQAAAHDALKSINATVFDAFSFMYLHCKRDSGKVACPGNVSMRNLVPGTPGQEPYEQLIAKFRRSASN